MVIASFVADLPLSSSNYVFYIAMPSSAISISSQTLRQVFSAVKRAQRTRTQEQILFQFIPAQLVYSLKFSSAGRGGVFAFACSIYNRILSPVDRVMSRQIVENSLRTRDFFQEPAFSLARPLHTKVHFVRQFPVLSLDVVDRHTLLHVGYRLSSCGKWAFACCVDQRGEAHDLAVWLLPNESPEAFIAQHLWTFVVGVAKRASVEWRIVIAKLGTMDTRELEGMSSSDLPRPYLIARHSMDVSTRYVSPVVQGASHGSRYPPLRRGEHDMDLHRATWGQQALNFRESLLKVIHRQHHDRRFFRNVPPQSRRTDGSPSSILLRWRLRIRPFVHPRLLRHWPTAVRTTPPTSAQRYAHQSAGHCGSHLGHHAASSSAALHAVAELFSHIIGRGHVTGRVPKLSRALRARSRPMAQGEPDSSLPFWSAGDHRPRFAWQPYSRSLRLMLGTSNFSVSCIFFCLFFVPFLSIFALRRHLYYCCGFNPRLDHAFLPLYHIVHTLPELVVEGSVNVLPPSLIATILSPRNLHDIALPSYPSLILFLVRTVALGRSNA